MKKRNPLNPNHQVRTRREFIDYDYVNQLSKEEIEFLKKFTDEYYGGGNFKRNEDRTFNYSKNAHKTDIERRECYKRNARQSRDLYNLLKISGRLENIGDGEDERITLYENFLSAIEMQEALELRLKLDEHTQKSKKKAKKPKRTLNKT